MPEPSRMARPRLVPSLKRDEPGKRLGSGSNEVHGRSCVWTTIQVTSVGKNTWRTSGGWRRMWLGQVVKGAVPPKLGLLCYPACCDAVAAGENSKFITVVGEGEYHDMSVMEIEE